MSEQSKPIEPSDPIVTKFQEAIYKFESLAAKVEPLIQILADLSGKNVALQSGLELANQAISALTNKVDSSNSLSTNKFQGYTSLISDLQNNYDFVRHNLIAFGNDIDAFRKQIPAIEDKLTSFVTPAHLALHSNRIDSLQTSFHGAILEIHQAMKDVLQAHKNLKDQVSQVAADLNIHANSAKTITDSVKNLSDKINSVSLTSTTAYHDLKGQLSQEFDKKLDAIPKPSIPDVTAPIKEMQSKFEPARLDAANANLRSENNEKKITILEKKIEQLQLLLNKAQLGS